MSKNVKKESNEKGSDNVKEWDKAVEQATKLGLGFAIVSKDALESLIKKVSKDKSITETEARKAVNEVISESKQREAELKKQIKKTLKTIKTKSPVVSKKEVDKLKAEIKKLKEQLKKKK